jgi:hypothetical protein
MFVVLGLYSLLKGVDKMLALQMLIFAVVQIPLIYSAEVHHLAALTILKGNGSAAAFSESQRIAQMKVALDAYDNGTSVTEIFMGLWLFPLAALIYRSNFLPRFLGILLVPAGSAYFVESVTWLLLPGYGHVVSRFSSPLRAVELVIPLWLLIMGAKDQPLAE